jgi:hypothetical protein
MAGTLVFLVFLWVMDFPKPMVDDLFYIGAGLNMAGGGDFSNPLLARQEFPGHFFFVYPPLHSYAIWGWMKLFGISAASLTGFQMTMYLVTALSTIVILRKQSAPVWLEWLVPLGVTTAFLPLGLRPEPLAVALTMAGFALFVAAPRRTPFIFAAFLLMLLGGSAAPRMTVFSAALASAAGYGLWREKGAERRILWITGLAALLSAFFIFLFLIHFQLGEFWRVFHFHSQRVRAGKFGQLVGVIGYLDDSPFLRTVQLPLVVLSAWLFLFGWKRKIHDPSRASLFIVGCLPVVVLTGALGEGTVWYAIFILLLVSTAVLGAVPEMSRELKIILPCAFMLAGIKPFVICYGMLAGHIQPDKGPDEPVAFALRSTPAHPVLLDRSVARYVFDYKIPPGFIDLQFSAPFPGSYVVQAFRGGDIYLAGPENVDLLKLYTHVDRATPKWVPLGLPNRQFDCYPRRVFVIPEEECGGLRADG